MAKRGLFEKLALGAAVKFSIAISLNLGGFCMIAVGTERRKKGGHGVSCNACLAYVCCCIYRLFSANET